MKRLDHRVVLCPSANFSRLTFATGGEQATVARCLHETAFIIPIPMETGLKNRVVIVAASSQGIGRATAEAFAAEGAKLAICARKEKTLTAAAEEIRSRHHAEVFALTLDVTDADEVRRFVQAVAAEFGRIDICVTNAGGPPAKNFLSISIEEWRHAVELNFLSVVHFAREVIPHMQRNRWGRFITINSLSVKKPIT